MSNGINPNKIMIGSYYEYMLVNDAPTVCEVVGYMKGTLFLEPIHGPRTGAPDFQVDVSNPRLHMVDLNDDWLGRFGFTEMARVASKEVKHPDVPYTVYEKGQIRVAYYPTYHGPSKCLLVGVDGVLKPLSYVHELQVVGIIYDEELTIKNR